MSDSSSQISNGSGTLGRNFSSLSSRDRWYFSTPSIVSVTDVVGGRRGGEKVCPRTDGGEGLPFEKSYVYCRSERTEGGVGS